MQPSPPTPSAWDPVLDAIQRALVRVEAEAASREQALTSLPGNDLADAGSLPGGKLPPIPAADGSPLRACVREAEAIVTATGAALQADEEALRGWLAAVAAARTPATPKAAGGSI